MATLASTITQSGSVLFVDNTGQTVNGGSAAADRVITLIFNPYAALLGAGTIESVTIGGITATRSRNLNIVNASAFFPLEVYSANVPTGTNPSVVVQLVGGTGGAYLTTVIRTTGDATAEVVDVGISGGLPGSAEWYGITEAGDNVILEALAQNSGSDTISISFNGVDSQGSQFQANIGGIFLLDQRIALLTSTTRAIPETGTLTYSHDGPSNDCTVFAYTIGSPRDPYGPIAATSAGEVYEFLNDGEVRLSVVGNGGSGGNNTAGGGGGASAVSILPVTAGDILYGSGAPGAIFVVTPVAGPDVWLRLNTDAAPTSTSEGVLAKGGGAPSGSTPGAGGLASASIGQTKYSGGSGSSSGGAGAGGGGAGDGGNGANASGDFGGAGGIAGGAGLHNFVGGDGGTAVAEAADEYAVDGSSPGGGGGSSTSGVWMGDGASGQLYFQFIPAEGGSGALTASLFTDTDTFFAPSVVGPRVLSPSLFADTDAFFTPTVTRLPIFGELLGTLGVNAGSITASFSATGSVDVSVGDLIISVVCQQTSLTVTGVTDNLSNSYSAQNAGTDAGNVTGRCFYSIATNAGTLTTVTAACTGSTNDGVHIAAVIKGPFQSIDANVANITSDITSPFTCPSSGTLAQAQEVVIGWGVASYGTAWSATSPNLEATERANSTTIKAIIGYQAVSATTAVSPAFTAGSNPGQAVLGTLSFRRNLLQTLTADLFVDTDSFFSPAVSQGTASQNLDTPLYTDTDTFHAATVTTGAVGLTAPLFTDTDTFFNQTVGSTYALTAPLFTDTDAFFSATVTPGAVTLAPPLYTDTDSFFDPAVTGAYTIAPPLFTDTDTFFSATVAASQSLTAPLFSDADAFFAATVTASNTLVPALYVDTDSFFSATITGSYTITAPLFADTDAFFSPTVAQTQALTPALFTETDIFFTPVVTRGVVTLTPTLYSEDDQFYSPVVSSGVLILAPDLFTDADAFHSATITTGAVSMAPALFTDTDVFHVATVTAGGVTLTPGLFTDTDAFFAATALNVNPLTPPLLEDSDSFYAATVTSTKTLAPALFVDTDTFFDPLVERGQIRPDLFTDTDVFFTPVITTGPVNIAPSLFVDQDFFQSPVAAITFGREGGGTSAARRDPRLRPGLQQLKARPKAPKKKERELPEWHPEALPEPETATPELETLAEVIDPRLMPQMDALSQMRAAIAAAERAQIEQDEQDAADIADILALLDEL